MGYETNNVRLFCYIDFPKNILKRDNDSTCGVSLLNRQLVKESQLLEKKVYIHKKETKINKLI
jgi:hypothetical protein